MNLHGKYDPKDIPVVILCGGQGTRIRDVGENLPKPLISIGGKPILWHIMKSYAAHGFTNFILCLGYKGWAIKEFFLNYAVRTADFTITLGQPSDVHFHGAIDEASWKITFLDTGLDSMTGHRLWRIRNYLEPYENFCLTYGDGLSDLNLTDSVAHHVESGLAATILSVRVASRFGEVKDVGGRIYEFNEKPAISEGRINGGFMTFSTRQVWKYFDEAPGLVLEKDPFHRMVADDQLGAFKFDGYWQCMDTYREYLILNDLWASGQAPWTRGWTK